jgi:hypothetical protein
MEDAEDTSEDPHLDAFLADAQSVNGNVTFPGFSYMYVRKAMRELPGVGDIACIDLASLRAERPGHGAFTALIAHLRARYPGKVIFAESVTNERLCGRLERIGFQHVEGAPPCYFLASHSIDPEPGPLSGGAD